jgi:hypothetical protein
VAVNRQLMQRKANAEWELMMTLARVSGVSSAMPRPWPQDQAAVEMPDPSTIERKVDSKAPDDQHCSAPLKHRGTASGGHAAYYPAPAAQNQGSLNNNHPVFGGIDAEGQHTQCRWEQPLR